MSTNNYPSGLKLVGLVTPIPHYPCRAVPVYSANALKGPFYAHLLNRSGHITDILPYSIQSENINITINDRNILAFKDGPGVAAFAVSIDKYQLFRSRAEMRAWYDQCVVEGFFDVFPVFGLELARLFNDIAQECVLAEKAVEHIARVDFDFAVSWVLRSNLSERAKLVASDRLSVDTRRLDRERTEREEKRPTTLWCNVQVPLDSIVRFGGAVEVTRINYDNLLQDISILNRPDYIILTPGDLYNITFNQSVMSLFRDYKRSGTLFVKIGSDKLKYTVLPSAHAIIDIFVKELDESGVKAVLG